MDAKTIQQLQPELDAFLARFADCFPRRDTRAHLAPYVTGQLSDLKRKNVEAMALEQGVPVRTLQEFLSQHQWDEDKMRDRVQEIVRDEHAHEYSIGIIDETSDDKKGDQTPGVQRQYLGCSGKTENGVVTVHLAYATPQFHCLIDGDLFLPESWSEDRCRCRQAGIPDDLIHRPKWKIALEQHQRAIDNGLKLNWLTFDEAYGQVREFLRELDRREQLYVGEVPKSFTGWISQPETTARAYRKGGRGRGRKTPRLKSSTPPARSVEHHLLYSPVLRDQEWIPYHVKDGEKGPMVWEAKHVMLWVKAENGLPSEKPLHLLVCRNALNREEVKYFVSNAPAETPVGLLLSVAFSRWRVERCFQDGKGQVGLTDYEGRKYQGMKRHWTLSLVSFLFLAQVTKRLGGEKSRVDCLPESDRRECSDPVALADWNGENRTD